MCGAIRFAVGGEPDRVGICHCHDCRRFSGSAYTFFAVWPADAFSMTGTVATFQGRSFCPDCGSRLFSVDDREVEIMVGALDAAPGDLVPQYELWTPRREHWLHALPWATQFEKDRLQRPKQG